MMNKPTLITLFLIHLCALSGTAFAQDKPNIVLVFMDNFGIEKLSPGKFRMILRMAIGFVFIAISSNTFAQFNGHNLRGDFGLFSGSQPGPGWYAGVMGVNYDVDSLRDRNGDNLVSAGGSLEVNAIAPYVWWVSDKKVFGGNLQYICITFVGG